MKRPTIEEVRLQFEELAEDHSKIVMRVSKNDAERITFYDYSDLSQII